MPHGAYIIVRSGREFWPMDPHPADVRIEDIAHALSNQCRFSGHTKRFYSVAQHSVLVSRVVPPADALWGLLHDASEAYLVDLPRPLKHLPAFEPYRKAEAAVMGAICDAFGLPLEMPESVALADVRMCSTEIRDLMPPGRWGERAEPYPFTIAPWAPGVARDDFLAEFHRLTIDGREAVVS